MRDMQCSILLLFAVFCASTIPLNGEPNDYTGLAKRTDIQKLIRDYYVLKADALAVPDGEKRPDLYMKARYWASRNVNLRLYCQNFFRQTPHTVQTATSRVITISFLGELTSEWSVRFLFEEVMIDRSGQGIQGYDGEISEANMNDLVRKEAYLDFVRNDHKAARALLNMKLVGAPSSRFGNLDKEKLKELRAWYSKNKHRLDEVVKETWGEYAVLDKDMGVAAQDKTVKKNPRRSLPSRDHSKPAGAGDAQRSEGTPAVVAENLQNKWPVIAAIMVILGVVYVWLKSKPRV